MGSGMSGGGGGGDGGGLSSGSASRSDSKGLSVASAGMILKRLHSWKPESAKLTGSDVIQTLQSMDAFGFEPNPTPSYKTVFGAIVTLFGGLLYTTLIMSLIIAFFAAEAELALAGVAHEPAMALVSPAMASLGDAGALRGGLLSVDGVAAPARPQIGIELFYEANLDFDSAATGDAEGIAAVGTQRAPQEALDSLEVQFFAVWTAADGGGAERARRLPAERCEFALDKSSAKLNRAAICPARDSRWALQGSRWQDDEHAFFVARVVPRANASADMLVNLRASILLSAESADTDGVFINSALRSVARITAQQVPLSASTRQIVDVKLRPRLLERESWLFGWDGLSTYRWDLPVAAASYHTASVFADWSSAANRTQPLLVADFSLATEWSNLRVTPDLHVVDVLGLLGSFLSLVVLGLGIPTRAFNAFTFHNMMRHAIKAGVISENHVDEVEGEGRSGPGLGLVGGIAGGMLKGVVAGAQGVASSAVKSTRWLLGSSGSGTSQGDDETEEVTKAPNGAEPPADGSGGEGTGSGRRPGALSTAPPAFGRKASNRHNKHTPPRSSKFQIKQAHAHEVINRLMRFEAHQRKRTSRTEYRLEQAYLASVRQRMQSMRVAESAAAPLAPAGVSPVRSLSSPILALDPEVSLHASMDSSALLPVMQPSRAGDASDGLTVAEVATLRRALVDLPSGWLARHTHGNNRASLSSLDSAMDGESVRGALSGGSQDGGKDCVLTEAVTEI